MKLASLFISSQRWCRYEHFSFYQPGNTGKRASQAELPMFREYAYDFENNRLLLRDGNTYLVEGNEALRIWIFKALSTERFRYTAYDSAFGSEIHTLIGSTLHSEIVTSELKRFIIEALMVNPYISELSNFQFTRTKSGIQVEFDCTTIYGAMTVEWDAKEVRAA